MATIGENIQGNPQEEKVGMWKQFLTRPENLATALIMATAFTSERRKDQSGFSKILESGVAGLGYRGGVQAGVRDAREDVRTEGRTVEQQAENIAAQRAQTQQGTEQLGIQRGALAEDTRAHGAQEKLEAEKIRQAGLPPQLHPSEVLQNEAYAGYMNRMPQGAQPKPPVDPKKFLLDYVTQGQAAAAAIGDASFNPIKKMQEGVQLLEYMELSESGAINPISGAATLTPEQMTAYGVVMPETQVVPAQTTGQQKDYRKAAGYDYDNPLLPPNQATEVAVLSLKKKPGFETATDEEMLNALGTARARANNKEELDAASSEELQAMLDTYGELMGLGERANVYRAIQRKLPPRSVSQNFATFGPR